LHLKQKLITGSVLLFIAALVVVFSLPDYRQAEPSLGGRPEKDFQFVLNGKSTRLSDLRGHFVVLNFWATWCQPCVDESPSLSRLQNEIAPIGGVVLGVDYGVNDTEDAYTKFLIDYKVRYPTYFDRSAQIALQYGSSMVPETYVIDVRGKIDRKIIGDQNWTSPAMIAYFSSLGQRAKKK
jgi:cytochrome c biogenesis protein CcmG/thiol:disulfide interchange protein DsbE